MFRLVNLNGRAALQGSRGVFDLARLSGDESLADPMVAISRHRELHSLSDSAASREPDGPLEPGALGAPVPSPRQVFGIGLNYRDHAEETGAPTPPAPLTFTKFPSCIVGPRSDVALSGDTVDWEVELVVVIGDTCRRVEANDAWTKVAGLTLGQDVSDRTVQRTGTPPQFNLGKSFSTYGPIGPALVSVDSFVDPDDVQLSCEISGEQMQHSSSAQLIFSVPTLVSYLSSVCELSPGDLIFTGTPSGVGAVRGRFLRPGDVIVSRAEVIGEMHNRCVAGEAPFGVEPSAR